MASLALQSPCVVKVEVPFCGQVEIEPVLPRSDAQGKGVSSQQLGAPRQSLSTGLSCRDGTDQSGLRIEPKRLQHCPETVRTSICSTPLPLTALLQKRPRKVFQDYFFSLCAAFTPCADVFKPRYFAYLHLVSFMRSRVSFGPSPPSIRAAPTSYHGRKSRWDRRNNRKIARNKRTQRCVHCRAQRFSR
jgi:hypothetical protein